MPFMKDGWLLDLVVFLLGYLYLFMVPFTKVEESFNVQATFDMIFHPFSLSQYDHFFFPGVVPRTCLGAALLSLIVAPLQRLCHLTPQLCLLAVRGTLFMLMTISISLLRRAVSSKFGTYIGKWFILITCCQFHLLFYGSRLLPNMFALVLTNLGFGALFSNHIQRSFFIFCFACCVFRFELSLLIGAVSLVFVVSNWRLTVPCLKAALLGSLFASVFSITIDSFFWKRLCFPEFEVFYFNVIRGLHKHWGILPFHWYVSNALPRLLMGSICCIPFGLFADRRTWTWFTISFVYILLYSFLGHKEVRFIFYVVPLLNVCSAVGFEFLRRRRNKSFIYRIFYQTSCTLLALTLLCSLFWLWISSKNYPGAEALNALHRIENEHVSHKKTEVLVHIDAAAAMTGVSRYLELGGFPWKYSRAENISEFDNFDYLVTERSRVENFTLIYEQFGFSGIDWKRHKIVLRPLIFVHKNTKKMGDKCF